MRVSANTLTKGVGKFPTHLRLNSALAESLFNANKYDAWRQSRCTDLALLPVWKDKPDPKLMLGEYYARAKQPKLAEAAFRDGWAMTATKNIDIELRLVALLEEAKRYDDALELLKTNADDPRIASQRLQVHIVANHTDEAVKGIHESLQKSPDNVDLLNLLTVVDIDGGRYDDARVNVKKTLALYNENDVALYYQGLCEVRDDAAGDLQLALHNFGAIVTTSPRNVQFKIEYANLLQRVGDLESASVQLEEVLKNDPYNQDCRLKLLDIYMLQRKRPQFEKVVNFGELNPSVHDLGIWERAHAYALAAQNKYDQAILKIRTAMSMAPDNKKFVRDYLILLLQSKDAPGVLSEAERAVLAGHEECWHFHLRGLAYISLGDPDRAIEQLDKALAEVDPVKDIDAVQQVINSIAEISVDKAIARLKPRIDTNDRWCIECAAMNMRNKDWKEALTELQPLLARRDKLPRGERLSVIRLTAECYQYLQQFDQAKSFYGEWIKEAPNDNTALNNTAYLYAEDLHDPVTAKKYIQKAYEAGQKVNNVDPMIADTYGWVR